MERDGRSVLNGQTHKQLLSALFVEACGACLAPPPPPPAPPQLRQPVQPTASLTCASLRVRCLKAWVRCSVLSRYARCACGVEGGRWCQQQAGCGEGMGKQT